MAQFAYKARRRSGELVEGMLDVADRSAAISQIERMGMFPVAVDASRAGAAVAERTGGAGARREVALPAWLQSLAKRRRRPKLQELATFTEQLANLLKSGMPLTVAL